MFAYTKLMQAISGFSPSQLFAAGEQGVWYDPSDFSTMFQDSAGTIPVTAVEQPVGRILDKSGRGNHATQPTTTKRPILRQDVAGRYYLAFDGTDDRLSVVSINFTSTSKISTFAGIRKATNGTFPVIVESFNNNQFPSWSIFASQNATTATGTFAGMNTSSTAYWAGYTVNQSAPVSLVITGLFDCNKTTLVDSIALRLNASVQSLSDASAGTRTPAANFPTNQLSIGQRFNNNTFQLPFNGNIYSLIVRGAASSDTQILQTETWVNSKTGAY